MKCGIVPYGRCAQTAEILYPGISANVCEDLRECDFGEYEGKTYDQLKNEAAYQKWLDSGGTIPFPGGEDPMAFRVRSKSAFAAIAQKAAERHPGRDSGSCLSWRHNNGSIRSFFHAAPGFLRLAGIQRRWLPILV